MNEFNPNGQETHEVVNLCEIIEIEEFFNGMNKIARVDYECTSSRKNKMDNHHGKTPTGSKKNQRFFEHNKMTPLPIHIEQHAVQEKNMLSTHRNKVQKTNPHDCGGRRDYGRHWPKSSNEERYKGKCKIS